MGALPLYKWARASTHRACTHAAAALQAGGSEGIAKCDATLLRKTNLNAGGGQNCALALTRLLRRLTTRLCRGR